MAQVAQGVQAKKAKKAPKYLVLICAGGRLAPEASQETRNAEQVTADDRVWQE